ncbi:DUF2339 domain-containing protein [Leptospira sp. GIMC2001]|uniref:DUF2339 domain-containing protein n=1 Tax=Leptospira sp. GIMC2001 TaxID=1513297 RepID=UPI00234B6ED1|nr:DUF2339 domain-containing protein [Leptospira sp. GIMC2001]WCL49837.1 DUF2339 domain-containing protein [Leptospira sp. GIMC2001]
MANQDLNDIRRRVETLELELRNLKADIRKFESKSDTEQNVTSTTGNLKSTPTSRVSTKVVSVQPESNFWEKYEFLFGGNWIAKLGIGALLLASAWFLDLAFENEWIGDSGKIFLGFLLGFGIMGVSLVFARKNFRILPTALIGSGGSILYLTIFSAYRYYHFFSLAETFVYLLLLSILVLILSKVSKSEALYFFGYIGSFLSPVVLSTGENSYRFLFLYLGIHFLLFLYISKGNNWKWAPLLVFISNWLVLAVWMVQSVHKSSFFTPFAFANFLMILFVYRELFLDLNKSIQSDANKLIKMVLVAGNLIFGAIAISSLTEIFYASQFGNSIMYVSLVAMGFCYQYTKKSQNLYLVPILFYTSIVIFLISLLNSTEGYWVSLSLIIFAAIFAYMSTTYTRINDSKLNHLNIVSYFLWFIAILRLILEGIENDSDVIILNSRFIIYLIACIALGGIFYLNWKDGRNKFITNAFGICTLFLAILAFIWEVRYNVIDPYLRSQGYSVVLGIFASNFLAIGFYKSKATLRRIGIVLTGLVIFKFILFDIWYLNLVAKIISGFALGIILVLLGLFYEKFKSRVIGD